MLMFIICDENDVVQDAASAESALSRGKAYPNYKQYNDVEMTSKPRVGDTFTMDGDTPILVENTVKRAQAQLKSVQRNIVHNEIEKDKATELGFIDLVADRTTSLASLNQAKTDLEAIISAG